MSWRAALCILVAALVTDCEATTSDRSVASSYDVFEQPQTKQHTMRIIRQGETVTIHVTHTCMRRIDSLQVACPSDRKYQDRIELAIVDYDNSNVLQARTVPVGVADRSGSLSFSLKDVLPADFPLSNRTTVQIVDNMIVGRAPLGDWNSRKQVCAMNLGVCITKPLDVSDIAATRLDQRKEAQVEVNRKIWLTIKGTCGESAPTVDACESLRLWLANKAPILVPTPEIRGYISDAQATLKAAEPVLAGLREARDWSALKSQGCAQAVGPTANAIRQACDPLRTFLGAYPNTTHVQEVHAVLDPADRRADALDAKEQASAKRQADEDDRREKAERQKQHTRCLAACQMGCSQKAVYYDACVAACPGVCLQ